MFSGNRTNQFLALVLSTAFVFGASGCRFKLQRHYPQPDLSGPPPQAPPTPNWKSKKGFIKAVGMLPGAETSARAFWTKENKLFVAGIPVGLWSKYYKATEGKGSDLRCIERQASFFPLWDPKTGKTEAVKGHQSLSQKKQDAIIQLPDGKLVLPTVKTPEKAVYTRYLNVGCDPQYWDPGIGEKAFLEIYDFQKKKSELSLLPSKMPPGQMLPMKNGKILFIKFPEAWKYPLDSNLIKEFTTTFQVWDPMTGQYGERMELYPGHFGEMTVMPNNQQVIVTGGHCFEKSDESKLFKLTAPADMHDFLAKCQSIELIDLKNKTRKQIGRVPFSTKFKAVYGLPVLVDTQRILYVGGRYTDAPTPRSDGPYRDMALFNIKTGKTRFVGRTENDGTKIESKIRFSDGSVAVVTTLSLYLFDQATESFKKVDDLITFPAESAAVASLDDKLYIVGGYGGGDPRLIQMFDYKAYKNQLKQHK